MNINAADICIAILFLLLLWQYIKEGFWKNSASIIAIIVSTSGAIAGYKLIASWILAKVDIPNSIANIFGFILISSLLYPVTQYVCYEIIRALPKAIQKFPGWKVVNIPMAVGKAIAACAIILVIFLNFPFFVEAKETVTTSVVAQKLLEGYKKAEKVISKVFGSIEDSSLTVTTIDPKKQQTIKLPSYKTNLAIDEESEKQMVEKVNEERTKRGIGTVQFNEKLQDVARAHAKDMWNRSYFGHISPEGKDVGNRLQEAHVAYQIAGENLALAPTVSLAHNGLMESEGHRENILEPRFRKIGIGVISNGISGKMFVQVFSD